MDGPFVSQEMQSRHGDKWEEQVRTILRENRYIDLTCRFFSKKSTRPEVVSKACTYPNYRFSTD